MLRPSKEGAALVAWLGTQRDSEATGEEIQSGLGFTLPQMTKAIATARLHGYVDVTRPAGLFGDRVVSLTEKAKDELRAGAREMNRAERRSWARKTSRA